MVKLIHNILLLENHVVGNSMTVGRIIFSIGVSLGYGYNLGHMYLRLRLVRQDPLLPRRRRILIEQ